MTHPTFRIPRHLQDSGGLDAILKRLSIMVAGELDGWYCNKDSNKAYDPHGAHWTLGRSNDFWLHRESDEDFRFNARYKKDEQVADLTRVTVWLLNLEHFQRERVAA